MSAGDATRARAERLSGLVEHLSHLLPIQGPIDVFVHHNTLHAFQHLPFETAVLEASSLFDAEPYMAEAAYRAALSQGRIQIENIDAVLDQEPDARVFSGLSRRSLRRAMITPGVREFDAATVLWRTEQGDLAGDFRQPALRALFDACLARTSAPDEEQSARRPVDEVIHPWLIRLCSAFLDQGTAYWTMPLRDLGFYASVRELLSQPGSVVPKYLAGLAEDFLLQKSRDFSSTDAVLDCLDRHAYREEDWEDFLRSELLALPGWAGIMKRLEEDPSLAHHERLRCSLMDFLAVRLTMGRVASRRGAADAGPQESPLKTQERRLLSRAARIYDAARVVSLSAAEISSLSADDWTSFVTEARACNGLERRRILHLAYERHHEREILQGLAAHRKYRGTSDSLSAPLTDAQVFFCIDEREESLRRALEEVDPQVETFGAAGNYGIVVDYQGIDDAQAASLGPVSLKPAHAVLERPKTEDVDLLETRRIRRRLLGLLTRSLFLSSRTLVRGWVSTTALGMLSAVPLAGHLLAPRRYAMLRAWLNRAFLPEPRTELSLMRNEAQSQDAVTGVLMGFATEEKTERVAGVLTQAGLTRGFAPLVVILGHGSTSLNNPHESAHDCGACGGRRGGPNARLFAAMANRAEVRRRLARRGIEVPDGTWFVGGYHDTCSDDIEFFETGEVPEPHRAALARIRASLDRARASNARERARRFERCPADASPEEALRHVEERSEHLAEPRPEYGHCTNAVCIVGRRDLTRGLFLDRRAFLVSYDAAQDYRSETLTALLSAVVPICSGISLEYYFSFVDNTRYGCGTKLPHNITSLIGVMDGHASDLRTGLPWQMVEIHEPVRILFVIEASPDSVTRAITAAPGVRQLLDNGWFRLATIDPVSGRVDVYRGGEFEPFDEAVERLPVAFSSAEWFRGRTGHLPMAWIQAAGAS